MSPALNNGLALLHLFDYCVPPVKLDLADQKPHHERLLYTWLPSSTAKVHVAGINSILVGYDDDKLEVNTKLSIYVQISDANGNLIKTKYFPLMNLVAKLTNSDGKHDSNGKSDMLATIDLSTLEQQQQNTVLNDQDREYTAIYVLSAIKPGLVSIQFEAQSDGYLNKVNNEKSGLSNIIKSQTREIQIFTPLQVHPKYIELIRDAYYQVTLSGGPSSPDSTIKYEISPVASPSRASARHDKIIDVNTQHGVVKALELGEVRVTVKSIGSACLPFASSTVESTMAQFRCHPENRVQRVYSEDHFVVKVVELHSINIQMPLKSIKKGNEMPIYLMANERTLSPLNFASASYLKYIWKVNDHQIATLQHPLLHTAKNEDMTTESEEDAQLLLENSYSLRFSARQSGIVKVTVRVEFTNKYNKLEVLTDSVDILVFDNPYFTHFQLPYYLFKYPQLRGLSSSCGSSSSSASGQQTTTAKNDYLEHHPSNQILMSPGTEFQVKTNYDKVASKITYKLRLYDQSSLSDSDAQQQSKSYCNNNTIIVSVILERF